MVGFEFLEAPSAGGGRYDALASDGRSTLPRRRHPIRHLAHSWWGCRGLCVLTSDPQGPERVCWWPFVDEVSRGGPATLSAWRHCVANGVPCEVAASAQKFGKQIRYAERRGIPYVWFTGADGHEVKDIRTGEQVAADPATWAPPAEDLRPRVTVTTGTTQSSSSTSEEKQ